MSAYSWCHHIAKQIKISICYHDLLTPNQIGAVVVTDTAVAVDAVSTNNNTNVLRQHPFQHPPLYIRRTWILYSFSRKIVPHSQSQTPVAPPL